MMDNSAWVVPPLTIQLVADLAYTASASSCQHSMTEYPPREARAVMFSGVVVVTIGARDMMLVRTDLKSIVAQLSKL
ncbi:hypothetical protein KVR01_003607 [Diaporthe batatas]|uniref:uncharacterized protein n=1 Tax=Diaporthe batatas TaxID=748121 RepID=UPI001D041906|nr:uncharacterized protein KVR01_003607 [Diaporthe batatas]KAG8167918.1 hypothetical protein KVR01_003607 [Diaporthe batatas]